MKTKIVFFISVLFALASCKKDSTSFCKCENQMEAILSYEERMLCEGDVNSGQWTSKFANGDVVYLTNLDNFQLEPKNQTIRFCPKTIAKSNPMQIEIECIDGIKAKTSCACGNGEWINIKPLEITCMALNCPRFKVFNSVGDEILINNLNEFELELKEQRLNVCFEDGILESNPPQLYLKCIDGVKRRGICGNPDEKYPYDPIQCENAVMGRVIDGQNEGGCKWLVKLDDGSVVNAINLGSYNDLAYDGLKISFAFQDAITATTICNKARPVEVICGSPVAETLKK